MFSAVLVLSGLLTVVFGASYQQYQPQQVPIISESNEVSPDGSYQWHYETGDHSAQHQSGQLRQLGHDQGEVVQGSASWTDPEGGQHQLTYVADENGYQPQSADIPTAPPVPAAILRALEWIAAHPAQTQKRF